MTRARLVPAIDCSTRVSPDDALIDRFQLLVGEWRVRGTREAISERLSMLSGHEVDDAFGETVNLFQSENFDYYRWKFDLSFWRGGRGRNTLVRRPLISGRVSANIVQGSGGGRTDDAQCAVRINGTWNLTRFIQAHEFALSRQGNLVSKNAGVPLAVSPRPDWWKTERPLALCDNVVIGKWWRYRFAKSRPAEEFLSDYVSTFVTDFIQAMTDRELLPEDPGLNRSNEPAEFRLGDIEFYWEFDHKSPIVLIDTLTHFLPRVAKRMRVTRRNLDRMVREVSQQSQSATIYLTRKREVRFYAKTNRRVRFEVCFPDGYLTGQRRSPSFSSIGALSDTVALLKSEAAETLNEVLSNLWEWIDPDDFNPTPDQLRQEVILAARNPFDATTIITMLMGKGRISLEPGDGLRPAVRRLATKKNPVLRTLEMDRGTYVVTPQYEYARRNLGNV